MGTVHDHPTAVATRVPPDLQAKLLRLAREMGPDVLLGRLEDIGRVPPHDLDAELLLLTSAIACAAQRPDVLSRAIAGVRTDMLFSELHRRVWETVTALSATKRPVELASVVLAMRTQHPHRGAEISAFVDAFERSTITIAIESVIERIAALWQARATIAACRRAIAAVQEAAEPTPLIHGLRRELAGLDVLQANGRGLDDVGREVWTEMIEPTDPCPPQWPWADCRSAFGPFVEGEVTYLCARPETGKTSAAFQIAESIAETEPDAGAMSEAVLFLSLEMGRRALFRRQIGIRAGVPARAIRERALRDDQITRLLGAQDGWATLPIVIEDFDGDEPTLEQIETLIAALRQQLAAGQHRARNGRLYPPCRLRLVAIDHLGQIRSQAPRGASPPERLADVAKGIKGLVNRTNVHALVLAHAGTRAEDRAKDLTMKDVFGGSGPERYADSMIFMTRPEDHKIKLVHAKSRSDGKAPKPVFLNFAGGRVWEDSSAANDNSPYGDQR